MTFIHNINPTLIDLGPLEIRYYGLIYVIGIFIIYFFLKYLIKMRKLEIDKESITDYIVYVGIGLILGARLFYVIAYNLPYYLSNPLSIIAVWEGGMSFHGGLFGAIIGGVLWCRKKKVNPWKMADLTVIPIGLVLFLGRIGNFINGELVGRIISLPWGVNFNNEMADGERIFRHPSQLYESAKNLVIFVLLFSLKEKKWKDGRFFWLFIMLYGLFRFAIEFVRAPDPQIGLIYGLTLGQYFTFPMFLIGWYMFLKWK